MFKRFRQLHISLAAKCQILFGAAVALIIAAALAFPWQRMAQLTDQINERSARTLCDDALADHLSGLRRRRTSSCWVPLRATIGRFSRSGRTNISRITRMRTCSRGW